MAQGLVPPHINVWPGKITQIIDPHYFWMHFGTNELLQQFELLQREIQQFCKKNWTHVGDSDHLDYGQVVLIDTGVQDGAQYKRGQVTRLTSTNSVDVFYVDYGLTELRTTDCICVNFPQNFKKWPPQAVRCSLAGILPLSKNWTTRATKTFQKVTEGKVFKTLVLYGEPGFCEVSLYPSESDNGRSVSHLLLDEDVAMPAEGKEVPEYFSEIMEFLAAIMPPEMVASFETREEVKPPETPPSNHLPSKPTERYVPPQRKNPDFALSTSLVQRDTISNTRSGRFNSTDVTNVSPGSHDSPQKSQTSQKLSPKGLHLNTSLDKHKPVNDFFPFENVSTYPATPTSPMKSPVKGSTTTGTPHGVSSSPESSYFSRTRPSKPDNVNMSPVSQQQHFSPPSRVDSGRYSHSGSPPSRVDPGRYIHPGQERKPHRHHDHRFAANLNNLPSPGRQEPKEVPAVSSIGTSLIDGQTAAANLEPSFLNSAISDQKDHYHGVGRSPKSPSSSHSTSSQHYTNTDYKSPGEVPRMPPFYPPGAQHGDHTKPGMNHHQSYNMQPHPSLVPPGFYAMPPGSHHNMDNQGDTYRSPKSNYTNNNNYGYGPNTAYRKKDYHDQYYNHGNSGVYNHHGINSGNNNYDGQYSRSGGYSPQKYTKNSRQPEYSDSKQSPYKDGPHSAALNTNYNNQARPQLKLKLPETPTKPPPFEKKGKPSPVSPDSADIGEFNMGDLDFAHHTSADVFNQRVHEEKLMALQEEAEDIAAESKEQSKLMEMASRYGGVSADLADDLDSEEEEDIFQQIAEEITCATAVHSKEYEDLKRSPIKRNRNSDDGTSLPPKLESIPSQFIVDIDFAEAVKEALEYTENDNLDNAKMLLDGIVESMKRANVEKQLFDVLMLMLAKAINNYDMLHRLILESISLLNVEMEITDCLAKALKRQQELCIRIPVPKNPYHMNCSRIMGHLFIMSHGWTDSNSTIQDAILLTVERWILFNNKGTQIGQTQKENLFLDCFGAFWEIAGHKLMDQNYSFRMRIQNEIKKKLLNENVSRAVRERLLEILLELFSRCLDTVSVHTQTVNRTMIPSSCQVKPSTLSQETMTHPVQLEYNDDMLDNYNQRWQFLSSDPSTYDRNEIPDLPQDSSKQLDSVQKSDGMADTSFQSSTADTSMYVTPNTSINLEPSNKVSPLSEKSTVVLADLESSEKDLVSAKTSSKSFSAPPKVLKKSDTSFSNVVKSPNTLTSTQKSRLVSGEPSARGRSIVDWFDYEPPSEETMTVKNRNTVKVNTKPAESSVYVDKSESEVAEKAKKQTNDSPDLSYPEVGQKQGKSAKSKRSRKNKKSSPNKDSVTDSPEKESERRSLVAFFDMGGEKAGSGSVSEGKVGGSSAMSVGGKVGGSSAMSEGGKVGGSGAVSVGGKVSTERSEEGKDVDWWGRDDPAALMDNVYMDTGPDVIIEGDEEVLTPDITDNQHTQLAEGSLLQSNNNKAKSKGSDGFLDYNGADNVVVHKTEVSVEELMDKRIQKMNDEYAFESESENDFDSDEGNFGAIKYEKDFPKSSLKEKIIPSSSNDHGFVNDNSYDKEFPTSNLADFIPALQAEPSPPPRTRWVPRKRVCLTCHDDGHTTENCTNGFLLLQ